MAMSLLRRAACVSAYTLAALCLAAPAAAQVYKWIDANGVTNYSNKPPAAAGNGKVEVVLDKVSYQPSPREAARAQVIAAREREQALAERIARLEREVAAERELRQYEAALAARTPQSASYADCVAQRGVDCEGGYSYPYYAAAYAPLRGRWSAPRFPSPLPVGVTAGNVSGLSGVTAGNVNGLSGVTAGNLGASRSFGGARAGGGMRGGAGLR